MATTFPILKLPDWSVTLVTVLILIGFPLALIFAWAFELTPDGIRKEQTINRSNAESLRTGRNLDFIIISILTIALIVFAVDKFRGVPDSITESNSVAKIIATEVQKSIAVLPFVNMSSDPEQEFFSDGMSEEILNLLAKIPDLKVIGRTSSFAYKGKNEDLRVIGEALGVATVLEGSVRKSGNQIRITAQLIDVSDGAHLWSGTYDRTLNNIFTVQDDVAAAIIDALQMHVGTLPTRGRPTGNTEAYVMFLKARTAYSRFEYNDTTEYLHKALALDPNFAEAYELLALHYWSSSGFDATVAESQTLVHDAAASALAINSDLTLAEALLESAIDEGYSFLRELQAFERAARELNGNPAVFDTLIYQYLTAGYLREAVGVAERYVERDPLSAPAILSLADALYAAGRSSEAIDALNVAEQLDFDFQNWFIGEINLVKKRDDIAIAQFEADLTQNGLPSGWVRELVNNARDPDGGQAYLDRRIPQIIASMPEEKSYEFRIKLTLWYLLFEFRDRYLEVILESRSVDSGWTGMGTLVWVGTVYRELGFTAHPKYLEIAEDHGYFDVWEQRGPPDFCEQSGREWICE